MSARSLRYAAAPAVALAVLVLAGADDATKPARAGEVSYKVPASWKSETPKSSMRKGQFKIGPAEGDTDPAELLVFQFPNGAGTVEANVDRWEKMFVDADGKPARAKSAKAKGMNVDATRVEVSGRYVAAVMPGSPEKYDKPGYRLLGAIVQTDDNAYFFRLVGPEKTVKAAAPGFDAMIASMSKE
jgi:hypothetical protein